MWYLADMGYSSLVDSACAAALGDTLYISKVGGRPYCGARYWGGLLKTILLSLSVRGERLRAFPTGYYLLGARVCGARYVRLCWWGNSADRDGLLDERMPPFVWGGTYSHGLKKLVGPKSPR